MSGRLSAGQLTAINACWAAWARHEGIVAASNAGREARLGFLGQVCGTTVRSSKDLTRFQAQQVIDALKLRMGQKIGMKDGRLARKMGTEGRRHDRGGEITLASATDLERIADARCRLGWSPEQLRAWLRRFKIGSGANHEEIKTLKDANRAWSGLKPQLKRAGAWEEVATTAGGR